MITVFYDGKCNLCSKEIKYYKSIADENVFNWFDIANDPKHLKSINIFFLQVRVHIINLNNKVVL